MNLEIEKPQKFIKKLSKSAILKHLSNQGIDVIVYSTIDSTNTQAKTLLKEGKEPPFLILSNAQTAGRGRQGNTFFSPENGFYYSFAIRPKEETTAIGKTTIAASVALREAIVDTAGISCDIKWVNDLYRGGKKVAGILCEAVRDSHGSLLGIVIGIGVNVYPMRFPKEIATRAGSLNTDDLDRNELAAVLTGRLLEWMEQSDSPALIQEYKKHSFLPGNEVSFMNNGILITGIASDINEDGNLVVEADHTYVLSSGEISLTSWKNSSFR